MLTVSEDSEDLAAALNGGAQGYVLKGVGSRTLAEILNSVAAGERYVRRRCRHSCCRRCPTPRRPARSPN